VNRPSSSQTTPVIFELILPQGIKLSAKKDSPPAKAEPSVHAFTKSAVFSEMLLLSFVQES
jgi:hypothetical protein